VQDRFDSTGAPSSLHYIRDKEHREIDFAVCGAEGPEQLIECKWTDTHVPAFLAATAERLPGSNAILLVRHLRQRERRGAVAVEPAGSWLATGPCA
jgi:hypothetical protein